MLHIQKTNKSYHFGLTSKKAFLVEPTEMETHGTCVSCPHFESMVPEIRNIVFLGF